VTVQQSQGDLNMTTHLTGSRDEWREARLALLALEKEHTRQGDELARRRQALPWVRIDKDYRFATQEGEVRLAGLFRGRSQLLIYHFMFGPDYRAGCPSCSGIADGVNGVTAHLMNHDVMFWAVSRAPLPQLLAYRERMGWSFPWASAHGSDFNFDMHVSFTAEQERAGTVEYNYRRAAPVAAVSAYPAPVTGFAATCGTDVPTYRRERPGVSAFVLENGIVYHTYAAQARGLDGLWGMYAWLDRAPRGRNESGGPWWRRHDEYGEP
jgi:predicted dithiol-disulfide oxidoreductase (DUF899 family)